MGKKKNKKEKKSPENINRNALLNYLSDVFFILTAIIIYRNVPYYKSFLAEQTQQEILVLGGAFLIFGFPYYYFYTDSQSKARKIIGGTGEFLWELIEYFKDKWAGKKKSFPPFPQEVKVSILFMIVKFYYLPLMLNFTFNHIFSLKNSGTDIIKGFFSEFFYKNIYIFLLNIFFLVDTLYYSFGYAVEAKFLKNEVKSVEPTLLGWSVALMCYPPFNSYTGGLIPWDKSEFLDFENPFIAFIFRFSIILLLAIYVWATLALGTKCSNLTNRGIVSRGPYAYVRHPAYISKNISWWIMAIPYMNGANIFGGLAWTSIYYLRAFTEERHLSKDPDYIEYCKKVKWRFIPYLI